jgi:hypothetical protein
LSPAGRWRFEPDLSLAGSAPWRAAIADAADIAGMVHANKNNQYAAIDANF